MEHGERLVDQVHGLLAQPRSDLAALHESEHLVHKPIKGANLLRRRTPGGPEPPAFGAGTRRVLAVIHASVRPPDRRPSARRSVFARARARDALPPSSPPHPSLPCLFLEAPGCRPSLGLIFPC